MGSASILTLKRKMWFVLRTGILGVLVACQTTAGEPSLPSPTPGETGRSTPAPSPTPVPIHLLSQDAQGQPMFGSAPRLSADGRRAVWADRERIFLWDSTRGTAEPLRIGAGAETAGFGPTLSGDGRVIAFFASAPRPETAPADLDCAPLAVYDLHTQRLEWTPGSAPRTSIPGLTGPALSADGRWLAWANDSRCPPGPGVFLYDRQTQQLDRVHPRTGGQSLTGGSLVALSADGRFLAFVTRDDGVVPDDHNGQFDVFLYDRETRAVRWVSQPPHPEDPPQPSGVQLVPGTDGAWEGGIALSADGRFLAFASAARLVDQPLPPCTPWPWAEPLPFCRHIYLYDREAGTLTLVDRNAAGEPGDGAAEGPALSGDGRRLAFVTRARNLGASGQTPCPSRPVWGRPCDLWLALWDRTQGSLVVLSRGGGGRLTGPSYAPALSGNGRWLAWTSEALEWLPNPLPIPSDRPAEYLYLAEWEALLRLQGEP